MNAVFPFLLLISREVYLASVFQMSVKTPMTPPPTHSPSAWRFLFRFQGWLLCCDVSVVTGSARNTNPSPHTHTHALSTLEKKKIRWSYILVMATRLRTLEYSTIRKRKPGALLGGAWPSRLSGVIILFQLPEAILGQNPVKQSGSSCLLFIYLIFLSLQASVSCVLFSTAVRYHLIIPSTPSPQQSHI